MGRQVPILSHIKAVEFHCNKAACGRPVVPCVREKSQDSEDDTRGQQRWAFSCLQFPLPFYLSLSFGPGLSLSLFYSNTNIY